ncbi:MAG: hypothetical protein AB1921_15230 [Thermodesulfobacteriota bacterium]
MESRLTSLFFRLGRGRVVGAFALLTLLSQATMRVMLSRLGADTLRLQLTFSSEGFLAILGRWGRMGTSVYMSHFWLDFAHPFLYSVFFAALTAWLSGRSRQNPPGTFFLALFAMPFLAGACDLMENVIHVLMIEAVLPVSDPLVFASGTASAAKWLLLLASALVCLALAGKRIAVAATKKGEDRPHGV